MKGRIHGAALAATLLFSGLFGAGCSPVRMTEAVWVLEDAQAGAGPSKLKDKTAAPSCATLTYRRNGAVREADIYLPGGDDVAQAGLLLAPGADPDGNDDPRFVAFAETMARARFEVVAPDIPGLRELRVRAGDADSVRDALLLLVDRRSQAGDATIGVFALSLATGLTTIALLSPEVEERVHFILYLGGYFDLEAVITFFTTGWYREDGKMKYREPDSYGKWFFAVSNADLIEDPKDRLLVERMGRRRLDDPDADLSDIVERLGPEGRAVYNLLTNNDPGRVSVLLRKLPAEIQEEIRALDVKHRDLSGMEPRFLLVHGNNDPVIPESQSIAFAKSVDHAELYILDSLVHVDPRGAGLGDKITLLSLMYDLLSERDRVRSVGKVDLGIEVLEERPCRHARERRSAN